jgi:hypothetical protein
MGLFNGDCLTEYELPDFVDGPDFIDQMKNENKQRRGV